jgi:hypothetical protein
LEHLLVLQLMLLVVPHFNWMTTLMESPTTTMHVRTFLLDNLLM